MEEFDGSNVIGLDVRSHGFTLKRFAVIEYETVAQTRSSDDGDSPRHAQSISREPTYGVRPRTQRSNRTVEPARAPCLTFASAEGRPMSALPGSGAVVEERGVAKAFWAVLIIGLFVDIA